MDRSAGDTTLALDARIADLIARGVEVVDPRQLWIAPDVVPTRVHAGARLWPGTRLLGARTFVAPGAEVGAEGPATLHDAVLGPGAIVDSGFVHGAVLLDGARLGANAHVRPGTLLEEGASTAHAVGLKQTILLAHVTLGSLINFCDVLMAGGTSRDDHSEVGSSFIHFNFTPYGPRGDKATASLIGDVAQGVMLRSARIFLGGQGGLVGPLHIDYGTVLAAGFVYRRNHGPDALVIGESLPTGTQPFHRERFRGVGPRLTKNLRYIGELVALWHWYQRARLPWAADDPLQRELFLAAQRVVGGAIAERLRQLDRLVEALPASVTSLAAEERHVFARELALQRHLVAQWPQWATRLAAYPTLDADADDDRTRVVTAIDAGRNASSFIATIQQLDAESVAAGTRWLRRLVERVGAIFTPPVAGEG